jgi:hypothetical protein
LAHQVQAILVHPPDFCGMIGFFIFYRVSSQLITSPDHDFLGSIVLKVTRHVQLISFLDLEKMVARQSQAIVLGQASNSQILTNINTDWENLKNVPQLLG